jgi:hypothetical protein
VEALRRGTLHAQEYAAWQDEDPDRALSPALVRIEARRYLKDTDAEVHNEEDDMIDFEAEYLSNLGLCIKLGEVQIRLLRSSQGDQLPVPGHSQARKDYYNQPTLFDVLDEVQDEVSPLRGRFVLHWSTDSEYNLDKVHLALPRAGGETRASVLAYWDWPIWRRHSLLTDGQTQAEVADLDIYLDEDATAAS